VSRRCNAYGAENPGGHSVPFGGFLPNGVAVQTVCTAMAAHRFRWVCEHGHAGPITDLCEWHYAEFSGRASARFEGGTGKDRQFNGQRMPVPWNLRRDVQSCPRCASLAPRPEQQHKCAVRLVTVS
jgi:hypothetical protein